MKLQRYAYPKGVHDIHINLMDVTRASPGMRDWRLVFEIVNVLIYEAKTF